MGSQSDLPVMKQAVAFLESLEIPYELTIVSAHRTPQRMLDYAETAKSRGVQVIIAGAGGAAHLPGMAAAITPIPVIGVPILTKSLGGVDSLYSIVQMPAGIPVATVAINGAKNAAILAAKIISVREPEVRQKIKDFAEGLKDEVLAKKTKIEKVGYKTYLEEMN